MTWSEAEARFATTLPGYESRTEQRRLAETIEKALANGDHLLAQAGTGTGKSLAGMVPSIEHALATGKSVIVSTATKALQTQYIGKDVPFLLEHLGKSFTAAVLKGRSNYACLQKISELQPESFPGQAEIIAELNGHETGDLDDLTTRFDPRNRPKITTSSDECPGKRDCPFGSVCFAEQAKAKAMESQLVVVNHALLATDLLIRAKSDGKVSLLPDFDAVMIDEAHELEEFVTGALGAEFTERSLSGAAAEALNFLGQDGRGPVNALTGAAKTLFAALNRFLGKDKTRALDERALLAHEDTLIHTLDAIRALWSVIKETDVRGDDKKAQRRKRLMKRFTMLDARFSDLMLLESSELVRWVESDAKRGTILKSAPLHVGAFLNENLWSKVPAVLMSATLAVGSDFSYIAGRLGIEDFRGFDAGTPFDYTSQAALYVPEGFDPSPASKSEWQMKVKATLPELIRAAGGRSLLLFTSTSAMRQAYEAVSPGLEDDGLQVLVQGGSLTNRQIAERFKEDETSVLFALRSFMTGFDVQGDSLRLVVLDKLPFPVPTDVIIKARADAIDAAARNKWVDGSFPTMTIPMMALTLLQAFGRLIRTKSDEGMVAILDSRLHTKPYGRKMLAALPPAQRVTALPQAKGYLSELTARRG